MGSKLKWRRALWWLNTLVFIVYVALIVGPYRDSPMTPFVWLLVPVLVPQIIWGGVQSWKLRRQRESVGRRPISAEELKASIDHAQSTVQLRSDTLAPDLHGALERAQERGVEIELWLGEEGVATLRAEDSPLPMRLWIPRRGEEERRLIIDRTTTIWGPLLSGTDKPFGASENVSTPYHYSTLIEVSRT